MATVDLDMAEVYSALRRLHDLMGDLSPALIAMGENLVESTKRRFVTETDPAGYEWVGNSPVTIERKGFDKPLTGETRQLQNTIGYNVNGNVLEWGSPMAYAAVHQFGGTTHWLEYDEIWDVPERPFLGVSEDDRDAILRTLNQFINAAVNNSRR